MSEQSSRPQVGFRMPAGRGPIWMRRIANVGFAIAVLYFVYLVSVLVLSWQTNKQFVGQEIGSVSVQLLDGQSVDLRSLDSSHRKAIVVWATWCGPCHSLLMDVRDKVANGDMKSTGVLAVSTAEPLEDVKAYVAKYNLPFQVVGDPEGNLARRVKLQGTPTVIFVDESGVIQNVITGGFRLSEKIAEFVK